MTSEQFDAVIVGAGFAGIGAAIQLKRMGIENFVILDREDDLGGTWYVNHYPGLAVDVPTDADPEDPVILTDGLRAVERHFGRLHDGQSATLAPGDDRRLYNPTRDYLPEGADPWVTWAQYGGISGVYASSSRSDGP